MTTMLRMITPNTNVDPKFAGFTTTGATDNQVLSYDQASDSLVWADISTLDNTFEAGITVSGAQSTFSAEVEVNAVLDVNDNIECSGTFLGGAIDAQTGSLTLDSDANVTITSGTGAGNYTQFDTPTVFAGAVTQAVRITPTTIDTFSTSGSATALTVTGNLTGNVTGNLTGNVTGNVTGNLTGDVDGDVDAERVEINNSTAINPGNWNQFSFDPFGTVRLAVASTSIPTQFVRERSDNDAAFVDTLVSKRTGDITGMESGNDLIVHNNVLTDTAGGGQRQASSLYTRLRNIDVIGSSTSDYQYDIYNSELEAVIFDKATGANEVSHNVATFGSEGQKFHSNVEVFTKPTNSGDIDLSSVQLAYVGTSKDDPDAYIRLVDNNAGPLVTNMVRFRDQGSGTYRTEFETPVEFNNNAITEVSSLQVGNLTLTGDQIQTSGSEVEFNSDFNVTQTAFFGSGSGTQIKNTGAIDTFGSNTTVAFLAPIKLDNLSSDPANVTGSIYFNTTTSKFRGYNGTAWVDLG